MTFMKSVDKNDITKSIEKKIFTIMGTANFGIFFPSVKLPKRPGELLSVYRECLLSPVSFLSPCGCPACWPGVGTGSCPASPAQIVQVQLAVKQCPGAGEGTSKLCNIYIEFILCIILCNIHIESNTPRLD